MHQCDVPKKETKLQNQKETPHAFVWVGCHSLCMWHALKSHVLARQLGVLVRQQLCARISRELLAGASACTHVVRIPSNKPGKSATASATARASRKTASCCTYMHPPRDSAQPPSEARQSHTHSAPEECMPTQKQLQPLVCVRHTPLYHRVYALRCPPLRCADHPHNCRRRTLHICCCFLGVKCKKT